ncbi:hypothetical protein CSA37_05375 [Candidatus Fermentibacteria bacterium]|nr:MAG: hypothetical protein CSA37_05375 [Candidatus Fermentibacteria bacterium]
MKKLILLTYTFPPLSSGGTPVVLNMCRYLPRNGWEVIPFTVDKPVGMMTDPTLEKWIPENTRVVRIPHRVYGYPASESNGAGRKGNPLKSVLKKAVHNYVLIPDRVISWRKNAVPALLELIRRKLPECVVSFGPHHSLHLIAMEACRKTDTPFIPFFGDLWLADSNTDKGSPLNRFIQEILEKRTVKAARGLIVTTEGSAGYFVNRYGKYCPPNHVAENAYDPDRIGTRGTKRHRGEHLTAGWTGNFFGNQTPEQLFSGFEMFYQRNPDSRIRLKMVGGIDAASIQRLERYPLKGKVTHYGMVQWSSVPEFQKSCDLLITYLAGRQYAELKNSSKTAEYLASGRAILAIAPEGDLTRRVRRFGRGYTVQPRADEIALQLENIEYQWKTSTLSTPVDFSAIEEKFSAPRVMKRLASFLNGLCAP